MIQPTLVTNDMLVSLMSESKRYVNPLDLEEADIDIRDIAHALSNICRFGGHTREFYSVGQHSILVSQALNGTGHEVWGLLHDASEAYLGDVQRPLKSSPEFAFYRDAEDVVMATIAEVFGLDETMPDVVKEQDVIALATEVRDLMPRLDGQWEILEGVTPWGATIQPWSPPRVKREFLMRFHDLRGGH